MSDIIFLDFDETKFNTLPQQVSYFNQTYGVNLTCDEFKHNSHQIELLIQKETGDSSLTRQLIYGNFGKDFCTSIPWHEDVLPMQDADYVIKLLAEKYTLMTVTARQHVGRNVIDYLLDKYMPRCISYVHCVYRDVNNREEKIPKVDFINSITKNKVGFIDDSPVEIKETRDTIPSFLFDPSHSHRPIDRAVTVHSWQEIAEILL